MMKVLESDKELAKQLFMIGAGSIVKREAYYKLFGVFKIKINFDLIDFADFEWSCCGYKYSEWVRNHRIVTKAKLCPYCKYGEAVANGEIEQQKEVKDES